MSGRFRLRKGLELRGFVMGSFTERQLLGTSDDASGVAAKLELVSESGLGLMLSHASGDSDGSGFLPVRRSQRGVRNEGGSSAPQRDRARIHQLGTPEAIAALLWP